MQTPHFNATTRVRFDGSVSYFSQIDVFKALSFSVKVHPHYKPDSIPIQSGSSETGSKLDSIHIDRVRTIVGSSAEHLGYLPNPGIIQFHPCPIHASGVSRHAVPL